MSLRSAVLSEATLQSISLYGLAYLPTDRESKTWTVTTGVIEDDEVWCPEAGAAASEEPVFCGSADPVLFAKAAIQIQVTLSYFLPMVTARRLRPLARRRFSTARPEAEALRTRNPWVRRREVRDGW